MGVSHDGTRGDVLHWRAVCVILLPSADVRRNPLRKLPASGIIDVMDVAFGLVVFALSLGLYFLPTIIAIARKVPNVGSVIVIDLLLGWLLVPWVIALAMAVRSVSQPEIRGGYQPPPPSPVNWAPPSPAGRVG